MPGVGGGSHGASIYAGQLRPEIVVVAVSHGATDVRIFGPLRGASGTRAAISTCSSAWREGRSLFDLIALGQEPEDGLDVAVDVLSEGGLSPYLRDRILSEAVPLCFGNEKGLPPEAAEPGAEPPPSAAQLPRFSSRFPRWRGPDSNRRHHDFQRAGQWPAMVRLRL